MEGKYYYFIVIINTVPVPISCTQKTTTIHTMCLLTRLSTIYIAKSAQNTRLKTLPIKIKTIHCKTYNTLQRYLTEQKHTKIKICIYNIYQSYYYKTIQIQYKNNYFYFLITTPSIITFSVECCYNPVRTDYVLCGSSS